MYDHGSISFNLLVTLSGLEYDRADEASQQTARVFSAVPSTLRRHATPTAVIEAADGSGYAWAEGDGAALRDLLWCS
jgi:hypothetical protein